MFTACALMVSLGCGARSTALSELPSADGRLDFQFSGELVTMDNGYRVAILPDANTGIVRVDVRYPVGSADDPPGQEGLAHLVEHLLFESQVVRKDRTATVQTLLGESALSWNASTTRDYTHYEATAVPEKLDELLRIEAERIAARCGGLDQAVFEREREVVLNELRQRQGNDGGATYRRINRALYPKGHPYHRSNSLNSVARLTLKDACNFIEAKYPRGTAVVIVSGKVTSEAARTSLGRSLAHLPKRTESRRRAVAKPTITGTTKIVGNVTSPVVVVSWPLPPAHTADYYTAQMAASLLRDRLASFAYTYKWGYSTDVSTFGGDRAPYLTLSVTLNDASEVGEALSSAKKAAKWVSRRSNWGEDAGSHRWRKRRDKLTRTLLAEYERLGDRAHMFAAYVASDDPTRLMKVLNGALNANPERVRDFLADVFDPDKARSVVIVPGKSSRGAARVAATFSGQHQRRDAVMVDPTEAQRSIELPDDLGLDVEASEFRTDSGLRVLLWGRGDPPVVHGRLVVHAGSGDVPEGLEGLTALTDFDSVYTDAMVARRFDLAPKVISVMGRLKGALNRRYIEVSDETKDYLKKIIAKNPPGPASRHQRKFLAAVLGSAHPLVRPAPSTKSVERLNETEMTSWLETRVLPRRATLILTGNFDEDMVEVNARGRLKKGRDSSHEPRVASVRVREMPTWVGGVDPKSTSTVSLTAAFATSGGLDETYATRLVLEGILDAHLSSLREERALTYGFYASYRPVEGGGYWTIGGSADSARAAEAGAALEEILARLRSDPDSYVADFVVARRKVLANLLANAGDAATIADRLTTRARYGLPSNFWEKVARRVAKLRPADVADLIARELAPERQVFGAFGNKAAVNQAISAAQRRGQISRRSARRD